MQRCCRQSSFLCQTLETLLPSCWEQARNRALYHPVAAYTVLIICFIRPLLARVPTISFYLPFLPALPFLASSKSLTNQSHTQNMSSCFGSRKKTGDREPLLPQYNVDTDLQNRLQEKFHTYQMVRALTKGAMPSTEQLIINLRALLASDILNPHDSSVTDSGRLLAKYTKQWLTHFIELLRNKNNEDQIQDFIWLLTQSKITLDTDDIKNRAASVKTKADAKAGMYILHLVSSSY